jgi:hypothetical protein
MGSAQHCSLDPTISTIGSIEFLVLTHKTFKMKTSILLVVLATLLSEIACAQKFQSFILYGGYSPEQHPNVDFIIVNRDIPKDEFQLGLVFNASQYQIGLLKNFAFSKPFSGSIGVEYSQQQQTYSMSMTYRDEPNKYYDLHYSSKYIQMPVGIQARMGLLDVSSGLLARYNFDSKLSGDNLMGITAAPTSTEFGFHAGVGINIGPTRFGVNYQSTFTRDGAHLQHRGGNLEMRSIPGKVSFTMGFSF